MAMPSEDGAGEEPRAAPGEGGSRGARDRQPPSQGPGLQPCKIPPGKTYCRRTSRIIARPGP